MFPSVKNPFWRLAVDSLIYQIGETAEQEAKAEFEQAKIEHYTKLITTFLEALGKVFR